MRAALIACAVLACVAPAIAQSPKDVHLEKLRITPASPKPGEIVTATLRVRNGGATPAHVRLDMVLMAECSDLVGTLDQTHKQIPGGQRFIWQVTFPAPKVPRWALSVRAELWPAGGEIQDMGRIDRRVGPGPFNKKCIAG
jgi:hypothetical protein